jgi:hypothetical protein
MVPIGKNFASKKKPSRLLKRLNLVGAGGVGAGRKKPLSFSIAEDSDDKASPPPPLPPPPVVVDDADEDSGSV